MQVGDMVKLAHHGTLLHKKEFEEYATKNWGVGLITRILPGDHLDQYGALIPWTQVEVLWPMKDILKIDDVEAVEVIN